MCLRLGTAWFGGGDGGDAVQELEEGGESNTLGVTSHQSRGGEEGEHIHILIYLVYQV